MTIQPSGLASVRLPPHLLYASLMITALRCVAQLTVVAAVLSYSMYWSRRAYG